MGNYFLNEYALALRNYRNSLGKFEGEFWSGNERFLKRAESLQDLLVDDSSADRFGFLHFNVSVPNQLGAKIESRNINSSAEGRKRCQKLAMHDVRQLEMDRHILGTYCVLKEILWRYGAKHGVLPVAKFALIDALAGHEQPEPYHGGNCRTILEQNGSGHVFEGRIPTAEEAVAHAVKFLEENPDINRRDYFRHLPAGRRDLYIQAAQDWELNVQMN